MLNIFFIIGRTILESTASLMETKPTVATTYSDTRFASSAFIQWRRLVSSLSCWWKHWELHQENWVTKMNQLYTKLGDR